MMEINLIENVIHLNSFLAINYLNLPKQFLTISRAGQGRAG
jgi:hypothetical protein